MKKNNLNLGTLYLVASPIGNFEDISSRALRILTEADAVFAEDTRRSGVLLKYFNVDRSEKEIKIESFHDHSSPKVLDKISNFLKQGLNVAYLTDGGLPVVSDPGFVLVREAVRIGATVDVIPGPSAATTAFALSAIPSPKYFFHGFFPRTHGEIEKTLEQIESLNVAHIFFESPSRIASTAEILKKRIPNNAIVLARELTKQHQEVIRGTVEEFLSGLSEREEKIKGECVLIVMGGDVKKNKKKSNTTLNSNQTAGIESLLQKNLNNEENVSELSLEQEQEVIALVKSGVSSKDAAKLLSKKFKLSRRVIYEFIVRRLT